MLWSPSIFLSTAAANTVEFYWEFKQYTSKSFVTANAKKLDIERRRLLTPDDNQKLNW